MRELDYLWDNMVSSGMDDTFEIVSQLSILMFLKKIDSIELIRESNAAFWETELTDPVFDSLHEDCRWHIFKTYDADKLYRNMRNKVFPFLHFDIKKNADTFYTTYLKNIDLKIPTSELLKLAVKTLDSIDLDDSTTASECYSYFLSRLTTNISKSQYRTPEYLADLMVNLVRPNIKDKICDPAVGTGGFLVSAAKFIKENYSSDLTNQDIADYYSSDLFTGMDFDSQLINIAAMNMNLNKVLTPNLLTMDSLSANNFHTNEYSLLLCNPPFSTKTNADYVSESLQTGIPTNDTAVLYMRLMLRMLKSGGRCAVIIPDVILFGVRKANMALKKDLLTKHKIKAIIPLTDPSIEHLGNLSFSILVFTKDVPEGTDKIWYYNLSSVDLIPDIVKRFSNLENEESRTRYDQSFFVSREEIEENNFMLIIDRYKKDISDSSVSSAEAIQNLEISHDILRSSLYEIEEHH